MSTVERPRQCQFHLQFTASNLLTTTTVIKTWLSLPGNDSVDWPFYMHGLDVLPTKSAHAWYRTEPLTLTMQVEPKGGHDKTAHRNFACIKQLPPTASVDTAEPVNSRSNNTTPIQDPAHTQGKFLISTNRILFT